MTEKATDSKTTYEAMFLLDNQEVRSQGFNAVRDWVMRTLEKHGIQARVLRLWGERKLAYRIGPRRRATYLLGWLEATGEAVNAARRDLYLVGPVFRVLFLQSEGIPEDELAFGIEEVDESKLVIPEDSIEEEAAAIEEESAEESEEDSEDEEGEEEGSDRETVSASSKGGSK